MNRSCILAMDSATGPCSVAVWKDGAVAAYFEHLGREAQSTRLMPMVEEALKTSNTAYSDLTAVACTIGPGGFTGIRVALAAARGIALAEGVPALGFTTLQVLAFGAPGKALAVLNAGKGEWYYQAFDHEALFEPRLGQLEDALAALPGAPLLGNAPDASGSPFPRADALAELAATQEKTARAPTPFYIREPDARPSCA